MNRDDPKRRNDSFADSDGEFHRFCSQVAAALRMDERVVPRIAAFFSSIRRVPLVWLQLSPTTKSGDAFARCTKPWAGEMIFARLPDGGEAVGADVSRALKDCAGKYLCVVEGAPPPTDAKVTKLGRMFQFASDVCSQARAVICVGTSNASGALATAAATAATARLLADAMGFPAAHVTGSPPTALAFAATLVAHLLGGAASLDPNRSP